MSIPIQLLVFNEDPQISNSLKALFPTSELQVAVASAPEIIGSSTEIKNLLAQLTQVATSGEAVLINGESGTEKEFLARVLHHKSPRKEKPFVALNCHQLENQLLEKSLFGTMPEPPARAHSPKVGLLECCHGGTLFINEIGKLDLSVQAKLVPVLKDQEFQRPGETRSIKVDIRVIAASKKNLKEEVQKGNFREDLLNCFNALPLELPPLRKRKEDIPLLIQHFLKGDLSNDKIKGIQNDALKVLLQYNFPGNIRELQNIIERTSLLASGPTITVEDLPLDIQIRISGKPVKDLTLGEFNAQEEKNYIEQILQEQGGNKTKAAKALGISRRNLYRKLDLYQL